MRWLLIGLVLVTSCEVAPRRPVLSGVWEYGFEHDRFRESGRSYRDDWGWCVTQESYDLLAPEPIPDWAQIGKLELVVEAEVSDAGRYGHMGLCDRQIRITRIRERRHVGYECIFDEETCARIARDPGLVWPRD